MGEQRPPRDPLAIDDDRGRTRDILAALAAPLMDEAEPPGHREIGVREEAILDAQPVGELLAPLVGIRADREDLGTRRLQLVRDGPKTLELRNAERSPVTAIEDKDDRLLAAVVGQAHRAPRGVGQREIRHRLPDHHEWPARRDTHRDEVEESGRDQQ